MKNVFIGLTGFLITIVIGAIVLKESGQESPSTSVSVAKPESHAASLPSETRRSETGTSDKKPNKDPVSNPVTSNSLATGENSSSSPKRIDQRTKSPSTKAEKKPPVTTGSFSGSVGSSSRPSRSQTEPQESIAQRVQEILQIEDPYEKRSAMHELLAEMNPGDFPEAAQVFQTQRENGLPYDPVHSEFAFRWGQSNGQEALDFFARHESAGEASPGAIEALRGWALKNPGSARSWIESLPPGTWYGEAVRGYIQALATTDPVAAQKYAISLRGTYDLAPYFLDIYHEVLSRNGLGAAKEWFANIPPWELHVKRNLFNEITRSQLRVGLDTARAWVDANGSASYRSDDGVRYVATALVAQDPLAALDWSMALPPSPTSNTYPGVATVISLWPNGDLNNLGDLLEQRRNEPAYDRAAGQFALRIQRIDDEAALAWAKTISDISIRNSILNRLGAAERTARSVVSKSE